MGTEMAGPIQRYCGQIPVTIKNTFVHIEISVVGRSQRSTSLPALISVKPQLSISEAALPASSIEKEKEDILINNKSTAKNTRGRLKYNRRGELVQDDGMKPNAEHCSTNDETTSYDFFMDNEMTTITGDNEVSVALSSDANERFQVGRNLEKILAHQHGTCQPCAYFSLKADGCRRGDNCEHCHFCSKEEAIARKIIRKRELRAQTRNSKNEAVKFAAAQRGQRYCNAQSQTWPKTAGPYACPKDYGRSP